MIEDLDMSLSLIEAVLKSKVGLELFRIISRFIAVQLERRGKEKRWGRVGWGTTTWE